MTGTDLSLISFIFRRISDDQIFIHVLSDNRDFFYIVEMRDELAPDANIRHRPLLLEEIDKYVTVIGDASKVSTITNAVYEGYHVALDI